MESNNVFKELLSFKDDNEKIEFEALLIHMNIIKKIKSIMKDKNINKSELSKKVGTTKGYITQLFCGDKLINMKMLAKLQRALDIKVEFIL